MQTSLNGVTIDLIYILKKRYDITSIEARYLLSMCLQDRSVYNQLIIVSDILIKQMNN